MISRWSRPRKPQRKPKPSAALVSISKLNEASLSRSLEMLSRSFSKSLASTGNRPAEDHRLDFLEALQRPRRPGLFASVSVSPTRGLGDFLDLRGDEADLARPQIGQLLDLRAEAADADRSGACVPAVMNLICWPFLIVPSITRTRMTTPR